MKIIITLEVFNILTSLFVISILVVLFTLCIVYTSLHDLIVRLLSCRIHIMIIYLYCFKKLKFIDDLY